MPALQLNGPHLQGEAPILLIAMGVAGTGKSTLGSAIASSLGWSFIEGDDLHPPANVEKMSRGIPLCDDDRWGWLAALRSVAEVKLAEGLEADEKVNGVVVTCSSLKKAYRDILRGVTQAPVPAHTSIPSTVAIPAIRTVFVYITGPESVLFERVEGRKGHFFKSSMLRSQLDTLEPPTGEDGVITVDVRWPTEEQVAYVRDALSLKQK